MKNKLDVIDIEWKHASHQTWSKYSHIVYRDERYKVQREQISKRSKNGKSTPKNYYFIDGIDREFTNVKEMVKCWNEIKDFDDPNNEIQWVKVIKPKTNEEPQT